MLVTFPNMFAQPVNAGGGTILQSPDGRSVSFQSFKEGFEHRLGFHILAADPKAFTYIQPKAFLHAGRRVNFRPWKKSMAFPFLHHRIEKLKRLPNLTTRIVFIRLPSAVKLEIIEQLAGKIPQISHTIQ